MFAILIDPVTNPGLPEDSYSRLRFRFLSVEITGEADVAEFRQSWKRPKWHALTRKAPEDTK